MTIIRVQKCKLGVLCAALAFWGLPLIVTAQPLDTPRIDKARVLIIDKKIILPPGQSGIRLEKAINLTPKNNDLKKVDSLFKRMSSGGDMSGGGSTLLVSNQRFFLDLFREKEKLNSLSCAVEVPVNNSHLLSKIKFEESCLDSTIMQAFDRVSGIAPRLRQTLIAIYKNLPFYFSTGQFRVLDTNFYIDSSKQFPDETQISTTALYIKDLGVIISLPQFRELNQTHQAALVAHEVLRTLQIQYSLEMTNAEIQEIVASLFDESENRLRITLKNSRLADFIEIQFQQPPILKAISLRFSELAELNPELGEAGIKQFKSLLESPNQNFWFDLSDLLAHTSSDILRYRTRQGYDETTRIQLEELENHFDRLVAQIRGKGIHNLQLTALNKTAELTGFIMSFKGRSFEDCSKLIRDERNCANLSQALRELIN